MSTQPTTTLRVPLQLRDEIARLAEERGASMAEVVGQAVARLTRDDWWSAVYQSLERWGPDEAGSYQREGGAYNASVADGL
jgi:predicted transcriptional regulator